MHEELKNEAIEMITTACEKYAQNYELAAKTIKESMDKKYWIVAWTFFRLN